MGTSGRLRSIPCSWKYTACTSLENGPGWWSSTVSCAIELDNDSKSLLHAGHVDKVKNFGAGAAGRSPKSSNKLAKTGARIRTP